MLTPTNVSARVQSVDALRGFAVMAILFVHNLEHFIFPVYPAESSQWLAALDKIVYDVVFFLFAGKAYAIFALLFGFTFYIQNRNQQERGRDFGGRFMWRLLLLACFACLNAAFFPAGDVLLLFSVVGGVLVVARNKSDKWILIAAVVLLSQPIELFCYFACLMFPDFHIPDFNVGDMYAEVASVAKSGDFKDFILCNLGLGQKASLLWAIEAGRFMQTAGLFLLGFLLGRKQVFVVSSCSMRFWTIGLWMSGVFFGALWLLHEYLFGIGCLEPRYLSVILSMWQNLAFMFVLVSAFMLVYAYTGFNRHSKALRAYGRMSLTNYISQSMIGALIYFPFGLYLAPLCGYAMSLLVAVCVLVGQMLFSMWWLSNHRQGPLEFLWHKLTWVVLR